MVDELLVSHIGLLGGIIILIFTALYLVFFRQIHLLINPRVIPINLASAFHFFYIYLFFSGKLNNISWLSGFEMLNNYVNFLFYVYYVRYSINKNNARMRDAIIWSFALLIIHLSVLSWQVFGLNQDYHSMTQEYIAYSIPEAFPHIGFIIFPFCLFLGQMILQYIWSWREIRSSSRAESSYTSFQTFFILAVPITMGGRLAYNIFGWVGGREWAVFYTFYDLIFILLMTIFHETYPLLIRAGILKPVNLSSGTKTKITSYDLLKQKIADLMKNEKPYLNESFHLDTLAQMLYVHRNTISSLINECYNCSFPEFLHNYRVEEAKLYLINHHNIKASLVGFEVGYKSVSAFYEAFQKRTGMSPQQYRDKFTKKRS